MFCRVGVLGNHRAGNVCDEHEDHRYKLTL